ncbi:hypothetical protein SAMN05443428_10913 [Caloramator quimbayensis]|uniref:Uncharacterized protein n=1 Tax=Caloramator quimbayensis TaxID=1147123 RepID=A0A1T4XHM6_9CLOT|nr:hypothetical protein SAMN05443428_10913 [Caloramator quimbayensis]
MELVIAFIYYSKECLSSNLDLFYIFTVFIIIEIISCF